LEAAVCYDGVKLSKVASQSNRMAPGSRFSSQQQIHSCLGKQRGEMSFAQFSKITGLTPSTLFRLEQCAQTITLRWLEPTLKKLNILIVDVFGEKR